MDIKELDTEYIASTYARFPLELTHGKGSAIYSSDGREYIDMGSGIAVNTFGIADDIWQAAVTAQLSALQHTSNLYYTGPCAKLAELLCKKTGMKKVFFSNSGAEANECAIKTARKYSAEKYGPGRHTIVTLKNSFHGRTITTLAATGQEAFHKDFLPLTQGFVYAEPGNCDELIDIVGKGGIAAIMFETVQGEGGVLPLDQEYVTLISGLAEENDILMITDEVQTGNGRTGRLYGYMNYGITPDIVSTAKGLGGGLPIGATLLGEKVRDTLTKGSHGSTFGGNPVCSAGAISIMQRIDDNLLADVRKKSEYIFGSLKGAKGIKSVTGMGLMLGIETEAPAADILAKCMEKGVLLLTAKNKLRLLPALNIPQEMLEKAIKIIMEVCAE